jgi:hypothetical protein
MAGSEMDTGQCDKPHDDGEVKTPGNRFKAKML